MITMSMEARDRMDEAERAEMEEMVIGIIVATVLIAVMLVGGIGALVEIMVWIFGVTFVGWVLRLMLW